jgi:hypothetical protein
MVTMGAAKKVKDKTPMFQEDRRVSERENETDRRQFLRPTDRLKTRGFIIAAVIFIIVCALCIVFYRP